MKNIEFRMKKQLPPLAPPYTGGGCAALRCYGGFLRLFLPLEKGELEGDEEMKTKNYKLKVENQKALVLCD